MKKIIFTLILLISINLQADTLKEGYAACISETLFLKLTNAIKKKDKETFDYLMKRGSCLITRPNLSGNLLKQYTKYVPSISSKLDIAKVRLSIGNKSLIIWTFSDVMQ